MENTKETKTCFVISPIGEADSQTRERSDQVLKHIVTKAVEPLGFTVLRADKISEPGIITTQIIEKIVDAELVIADLTDRNPNVFYELAIRHMIKKPLVQIISKGDAIPFDVAATRIIQFDIQNLDSVAAAQEEIVLQVKSLSETNHEEIQNPISQSYSLMQLKESGNSESKSLADIMEMISEIRIAINSIDSNDIMKQLSEDVNRLNRELSRKRADQIANNLTPIKNSNTNQHFEELLLTIRHNSNAFFFNCLVLCGFLRNELPWLYDFWFEVYKSHRSKGKNETNIKIEEFVDLLKATETLLLNHSFKNERYTLSIISELYNQVRFAR